MLQSIDINCDMGEGFGQWRFADDGQLMRGITTANLACGFHASDPQTMLKTIELASANRVAIGAHPGLPDLLGFGRRVMMIDADDMYAYTIYQIGALQGFLRSQNLSLHHVKSHGALYMMLRDGKELAEAFVRAIHDVVEDPLLYWPAPTGHAELTRAAQKYNIRVVGEIYGDIQYNPDGSLIFQRIKPPADLKKSYSQVRRLIEDGSVEAVDGTRIEVDAESVCVHSDGPNAADVVETVRRAITDAGCEVAAVVSASGAKLGH